METIGGNQTASEFHPLLILPVVLSTLWILWDLFYSSYVLAFFTKFILNLFLKESGIHIGQLHVNLFTGRVIFKNVHIYRRDDSIRIADGYGTLRWWRKPVTRDNEVRCKICSAQTSANANKKTSLIFLQLNGFEYHWYNRSDIYDQWGKPKTDDTDLDDTTGGGWITAIQPTFHCTINKGRFLFGNQLMEKTLVLYFDHGEGHYSMTQASNPYDELMHVIKIHGDNVRAVLEPSSGYSNPISENPPITGFTEVTCPTTGEDGYLVMKSDYIDCVYSYDMPGLVPLDDTSSPKYAIDVYMGSNSVLNYGTFVNRQRIVLQNFFFPNDYTVRPVDKVPQPGEKRVYTSFDVSVFLTTPGTMKLFFRENEDMHDLSFSVSGASHITIHQPWITKEDGYTTFITGRLSNLEACTSLPFRPLGKAQTLDISTSLHFPRVWNAIQTWDMKLTASHFQVNLLFSYVDFFNALIDDWVGNDPPDLINFVPLNWNIGIDVHNYEVYLFTTRYNWVDVSPDGRDNGHLAFCGKTGHIAIEFPFVEFVPNEQKISFSVHGHNIVVRRYFPPSSATRECAFALSSANRDRWRIMEPPEDRSPHSFHPLTRSMSQPIEPLLPFSQRERSGSGSGLIDKEEFIRTHRRRGSEPLLSHSQVRHVPLIPKYDAGLMEGITEESYEQFDGQRIVSPVKVSNRELFPMGYRSETLYDAGWLDLGCGPSITIDVTYLGHNSDATHQEEGSEGRKMVPSLFKVEVDAPCVLLRVFGSLARDLLALKENYPGEYMCFKTFSSQSTSPPECAVKEEISSFPDFTLEPDLSNGSHYPDERFLDVIVHFKLRNITAEFPTHLPEGYPKIFPLPSVHSNQLSVYLEYRGHETTVRLDMEPVTLHLPSLGSGGNASQEYSLGYLVLSGINFTCHGLTEFMLKERVEYAWMMKLDLGKIAGSISGEQLFPVIDFLHSALGLVTSHGDSTYKAPGPILIEPPAEPLSEFLKYKLFALTVAPIDVHLREANTLLKIQTSGFNLDLCNLHNGVQTLAVSLCLKNLALSSYINSSSTLLECACVDVGRIQSDISLREPHLALPDRQQAFLRRADSNSQRLWFLWDDSYQCGCCGGCVYLDHYIQRDDTPYQLQTSRYFSHDATASPLSQPILSPSQDHTTIPLAPPPTALTFDNLSAIEHLHTVLLSHHQFIKSTQDSTPRQNITLEEGKVSNCERLELIHDEENLSQDSEGSFVSAQTSLDSYASFSDDDKFKSLQNSPKGPDRYSRHSRRMSRNEIIITDEQRKESTLQNRRHHQKPHSLANYQNVLDTYKCHFKVLRIASTIPSQESTPLKESSRSTRRSGLLLLGESPEESGVLHPSPWHSGQKRRQSRVLKKQGPWFVLEIPEISHSSMGYLPFVLPNSMDPSVNSSNVRVSHYFMEGGRNQQEDRTLAFLSVSVNVIGNLGILISPPAATVLNRYISCANRFFTTRTAHLLLETISFEAIGSVKSHLAQIQPTNLLTQASSALPSNQISPLVHFSLSLSPSTYGSVQILHTTPVPSLATPTKLASAKKPYKESQTLRSSVVTLYTSGVKCNALIYHHNLLVELDSRKEDTNSAPANIQMTLKVAGELQIPVLQAGLYMLADIGTSSMGKSQSLGILPYHSILDFRLQLPSSTANLQVINISELSLNKSSSTIAAKIIQSELSSDPILTWSQVDTHLNEMSHLYTSQEGGNDSEQSNNTIDVNIQIPSVRLQIGGPPHGIPTSADVCIDPSIVATFVQAWKPLIEDLVKASKTLWRNKIMRDRQLLLALLTGAMETATKTIISNPLLNEVSSQLRHSTTFAVITQMWHGLSTTTDELISGFPSVYQQGFLLQELMATSLALAVRLGTEQSVLSSIPIQHKTIKNRNRSTKSSIAPSVISTGYYSISPSPSDLAVPNVMYHQQHETFKEDTDYRTLVQGTSYEHFVLLRESLLPFYSSCNIKVAPQLKIHCHNSSKLSLEYHLLLQEAALLVMDGRTSYQETDVIESYHVIPEFLLEQLRIAGSLENVVESRVLTAQSSNYLITVRHKRAEAKSDGTSKKRSNITSKCYVSLDTIATHVTLPFLMVCRHSSESLHHMRKSLQALMFSPGQPGPEVTSNVGSLQVSQLVSEENHDSIDEVDTVRSPAWITAQSLVQQLFLMEQKQNSTQNIPHMSRLYASTQPISTTPQSNNLKPAITEYSNSPRNPRRRVSPVLDVSGLGVSLESSHHELGEEDCHASLSSLTSGECPESPVDVVVNIETSVPPHIQSIFSSSSHGQEPIDDTTDSPQVFSSDTEAPIQSSMATYSGLGKPSIKITTDINTKEQPEAPETPNMREILNVPDNQLEFSVFGSIKIGTIQVSTQVETLLLILEIQSVSGAVDCRQIPPDISMQFSTMPLSHGGHVPLVYKLLPTYLSIAGTFKRTLIRVSDAAISASDLALFSADPLELCTSLYYGPQQPAPAYRCLVRFPGAAVDLKQPPIILHKKLHEYIPTFTAIYNEVFAPTASSHLDEGHFTTSTPSAVNVSDLQFPPHLPKGSVLFYLHRLKLIGRPLSSLVVSYDVTPITAQMESTSVINFSMSIGEHHLEFNPKECKDELSLRPIPLPVVTLEGSIVPQPYSRLPSITLEMAVKQVAIDVTTDVLNQLLILQSAFIKEINELLNMFFNIGESIPPEKLHVASINWKQSTESGFELISLLNSVRLSMQGIKVTVSTPLSTAIRFSTGNKIEMLITNPSHQPDAASILPKNYLTLHGKVDTEINVGLGYLQEDAGVEEEDDFVELAYFKTWITIRNTLQQNTTLLAGEETVDQPVSLDTFLISIYSPHLYIQSTAVEKAILFWVNCKSVYNFWQNEHKQLNAEVQAATEAFVERLTKPTSQLKTPSIDFSKPRLVQITITDVGACMPLIPLPTTPHASLRSFPALVLTIKDMQVSLNLSKKLASAGKFTGFLIRFDEQFHFRHKTWTIEPKKHKFLNYGIVPSGTYRFCIVNKPKFDDEAEKLLSAFTWHMSGININANTDIGRHISTLVRTLTTIGSDLEEADTQIPSTQFKVPHRSPVLSRVSHRRTQSFAGKSIKDDQAALRAMEWDLAKQTRKLQKLRFIGATPDSLKYEEDTFHKIEMDLARGLRRVFRKGRGMTFQQLSQILSPRSSVVQGPRDFRRRSFSVRRRLLSVDESADDRTIPVESLAKPHPPHQLSHTRHRSDISPDVLRMIQMEQGGASPGVSPAHSVTEQPHIGSSHSLEAVQEENVNESIPEEFIPSDHEKRESPRRFDSLIPSINIEVNVTINIDSGSVILHSEDLGSLEQHGSHPHLFSDSPQFPLQREKTKTSVDTVVLIPALEVKAHYQSIIGQSYSTAPLSPQKPGYISYDDTPISPKDENEEIAPKSKSSPNKVRFSPHVEMYDKSGNPIKKGVLTISVVIAPLPQDLELNPSVLDFVEQVVRPINITAHGTNYPDSDEEDEEEKEEEKEAPITKPQPATRPLSFPVEVCITVQIHPSKIYLTCNPHAHVRCLIEIPTVSFIISFSLFTRKQFELLCSPSPTAPESSLVSSQGDDDIATFNNLNITGCLKTFALVMYTPKVHTSSPHSRLSQKEDKEAFSLVLGQAFVHLSRKSVYVQSSSCNSVDDYMTHEKLKVSVIPMIESLILSYDWRRLNDITWFRKCWYHTGLVEALFIGRKTKEDAPPYSPSPIDVQYWSPSLSGGESSTEPSGVVEVSDTISAEIVVTVSVVDARLHVNVAQFMGNAHVLLNHLQGHSHADVQHNELVLFQCDGEIEEMEGDAQGGVVAGDLTIKDTQLHIKTSSHSGGIPEHNGSLSIAIIQGHIDYMSSHIMLIRATQLHAKIWDVWKGIGQSPQDHHTAASIQICVAFTWSTLQIAIHQSTFKALFGIAHRMYDFVMQQKKRSERTIGLMIPAGTAASTAFAAYQEEQKRAEKNRAAEIENPLLEHHHWVWAVRVGSIELMKAVGIDISTDQHDVSLGGSIEVSGSNMCLVCFHGTSFREAEWAVFNIDLINAKFSTIAIPGLGSQASPETMEEGRASSLAKTRICNQKCYIRLGEEGSKFKELAAVYRVSAGRGGVPPISHKETPDWLNYACIDHYIHSTQSTAGKAMMFLKQSQKLTIQPIIGIPAFEVNLINDHLWLALNVLENHNISDITQSATVECTLLSKFHEGISVTTTVENYLFLHDLFKAYVDHLERHKVSFRPPFIGVSQSPVPVSVDHTDTPKSEEPIKLSTCTRQFVNIHWELDPHLVLMAKAQWASGHFNPHISWLLEMLGFEHARTTIPKSIQRGLMDPLDLGIASLVELLIKVSGTKKIRIKGDTPPSTEPSE